MNSFSRAIWFLINTFFGAILAYTYFLWIACDMQMPLFITDFISTYLPVFSPLLEVPYVQFEGLSSSVIGKLIFDAFLYAIFGFCHTLFAQEFVQKTLRRIVFPQQVLRTIYCLITTVTVFIVMGFWQHTHIQLWNWLPSSMSQHEQQSVLLIAYNVIFAPACYVIIKFNPFEFCGMKQIFESTGCPYSSSEKRTTGIPTLVTAGLFRFCRHPLYFFTLLAMTITPAMSLDRLMIIIYTCLYAWIAIPIEERKLIQIFGQDYIKYQQNVPAVFPILIQKKKMN